MIPAACVCSHALYQAFLFDLGCLFCGNWVNLALTGQHRQLHECCVSLSSSSSSSEPDEGSYTPIHLSLLIFLSFSLLPSVLLPPFPPRPKCFHLQEGGFLSSPHQCNPVMSSSLKAQTRHVPDQSVAAPPPLAPPPSRPARPPATPAAPPGPAPQAATRPSPSASSRRRRWRWSGPRPSLLPPPSGSWRFSISPCLTWRM